MGNNTFLYVLMFFCLGCNLFAVPSDTADSVRLTDQSSSYQLNPVIEYLLDPHGTLMPEEVIDRREDFSSLPKESIQIPRDGVIWLLFSLENRSSKQNWVIENPMNVELMELFLRNGDSWESRRRAGNLVPFNERSFKTRHPAFEVNLQQDL